MSENEYIKVEDIKKMVGDDRLKGDILQAIETGKIPVYGRG